LFVTLEKVAIKGAGNFLDMIMENSEGLGFIEFEDLVFPIIPSYI